MQARDCERHLRRGRPLPRDLLQVGRLRQLLQQRGAGKVRHPRWTGNWPKEIPPLKNQLLASPEATMLVESADRLQSVFSHDLGEESLLQGKVTLSEGTPADVQPTPEGIVLSRTGKEGYSGTVLAPMIRVSGDFDATITFDQFECTTMEGKIGSARVSVDANNETQDTALIQRLNDREGAQMIQCLKMEKIKGAERRHYFGGQPLDGTAGRIRISRREGNVYYLFAENDSDEFRLLGQQEFSKEDLKDSGIRFGVQIQGLQGFTRARFRNIEVRAENIAGQALQDRNALVTKLNRERDKLSASFQHDFSVKPPSDDLYYEWGERKQWREKAGGYLIEAPGADEWASSGMSLRKQFAGDFDVTFGFRPLQMLVPQAGKHTQVYLQLGLDDPQRTQVSAMLTKTHEGALVTQAQLRRPTESGYQYDVLGTVGLEDPDYLRAARRGNQIYILAGREADDRVYLIGSTTVSEEPIAYYGVRMMLHTGHVSGSSQMFARTLDVRAESEIELNLVPANTNPIRTNPNLGREQSQPTLPSRIYQSIQNLFK